MRLEYEIAAVGLDQLKRVLRGAEQEIVASSRRMSAATARASGRSSIGGGGSADREWKDAKRTLDKWERDEARARAKAATARAREADKAANAEIKAKERVEKRKIAIQNQSLRWEQQQRDREIRDADRAEKRKTAIIDREANRQAAIARRTRETFARGMVRSVGNRTRQVAGLAGGVLGIGGGFMAGEAISSTIGLETAAGQIVRGATVNARGATTQTLMARASDVSQKTANTSEDVMAGIDAFMRPTGNLDAAIDLIEEIGKVATVTGAKLGDLGTTAGDAFNKLGSAEKVKQVLRAFAGQSNAGALDIRDLGEYGPRITASAGKFQGDLAANVITQSALAQLARKSGSAPTAAEATESALHLPEDIAKNARQFQARGVKVWADKDHTMLRSVEDILAEAMAKTKGSQSELRDLFGERSDKIVEGVRQTFVKAGGGAAGVKAVHAAIGEIRGQSLDDRTIGAGVAARMGETSAKITVNMERFRAAVGEQLLPVLNELIPTVAKLIPDIAEAAKAFAKISKWAIENPIPAIGVAIAGTVTKDIVSAKIGEAVKDVIVSQLKGPPPPGPGSGGAAGSPAAPTVSASLSRSLVTRYAPGAAVAAEVAAQAGEKMHGLYGKRVAASMKDASDLLAHAGDHPTDATREQARAKLTKVSELIGLGQNAQRESSSFGGEFFGDLKRTGQALAGNGAAQEKGEIGKAAADVLGPLQELKKELEALAGSAGKARAQLTNMAAVDPARGGAPIIRR